MGGAKRYPSRRHLEMTPRPGRPDSLVGAVHRSIGAKGDGFRKCSTHPTGSHYGFDGGPEASGGNSICGTSILIEFRSTLTGLSSRPVTVIGNAITRASMIACNPAQGSAPQ